ncbi:MAG: peptide/nickel transport system substrate-binding protein [Parasphingorhabdus sp.]|jgi:peptide/nickel transport system substrate-binding protein
MSELERLHKKLEKGRISRREFLSRTAAMGAVAAAGPAALFSGSAFGMPKKGGHFRQGLGHGGTTDSLDPGTHENGFSQNLVYTYANHLMEVDNHGQLAPELAESVDSSPDAKVWTFNMRQGVEFHNGKTMTPEDALVSINFHRAEDSKSAGKGLLTAVKDIKIAGNSLVFTLEDSNADFPFVMSDYHFPILPSVDGKLDWASGVGTGGYSIENYEPGVRATFKRNPNYWKDGRAHFDTVETLSLLDTTARQNAIMNDDVDVSNRVDPKTVHLLGRVPTLSILETTGTLHYTFPMRVDQAPFDNYDLRMAIKLLVDREELVTKILSGHGAIGNDHPISSSDRHHASNLAQRTYDPDKARHHLKKAGMEGATVTLSAADAAFAGAVDAAQLIKASAAKGGLTIDVLQEPKDGYWSNVWNKKAWCACYWGGRPTADWMFASAYTNDTEWNDTAWTKGDGPDQFNKLVKMGRAELDEAKRKEIYAEAQTLIHNDGGALIPMFANHIMANSKKIAHDDAVAGNWENDGNKCAERWWFA